MPRGGCGNCLGCWWRDFLLEMEVILHNNRVDLDEYPEDMMAHVGLPDDKETVNGWVDNIKAGFYESLDVAHQTGTDEDGPVNAMALMCLAFGIHVGKEIAAREKA